ncbi:MAG: hypothetical protein PHI98_00185 [Eubacteriales bacterium]|nr:hypothetical protein [Eubacteriales bacterium]
MKNASGGKHKSAGAARETKTGNGNQSFRVRLIKKYFIRLTLITMALCVLLCGASYMRNKDTAMVRISLNYEEANKGMAPNKTRLNMYEVISEDLLSSVIDSSDFGDITPHELRNHLSLRSSGSGIGDYISTEYILTANLYGMDIHTDPFSLLGLLCQAYTADFFNQYIGDTGNLFTDFLDSDALEYPELVDYLTIRLAIIQRFVNSRSADLKSFRSDSTGQTYVDIKDRVNQLVTIDLPALDSYIKQTGVVKQAAAYLAKLNYQIYSKSDDYQKQFQYYGAYAEAIAQYNILQTAVVMVPTYDENGEFYMSMTKTGIDDIALLAQNWNTQAANTRLAINRIKEIANNVDVSQTPSASALATTEKMVDSLETKISELTDLIIRVDAEYLDYKYKAPITYRLLGVSTSDKLNIKINFVICAVFYLLLWLIVGRREFNRSKTEVL